MKIKKETYLIILIAVAGLGIFLGGIFIADFQPNLYWRSLLLNTVFFTGLSLFGTLFFSMHILANAVWINKIKSVLLAMGEVLIFILVLYLILFICLGSVFDWVNNGSEKDWYLNVPFFIIRNVVILGIFGLLSVLVARVPIKPGDRKLKFYSAIFLVFFGISILFYAYDWIVSLDSHWYSTLFGWYLFSGLLVAGLSATIILLMIFDKKLNLEIDRKTFTNLGRYLFAFSMIWAYLWYVQYMLVWYVNKPDESDFYLLKLQNYSVLFYSGFIAAFVIPFVLLLATSIRGNKTILLIAALSGLAAQWLDKAFYIWPVVEKGETALYLVSTGMFVILSAIFYQLVKLRIGKRVLIINDKLEDQ